MHAPGEGKKSRLDLCDPLVFAFSVILNGKQSTF